MAAFLDTLLPSVHDTLTVREALSKLAYCERQMKSQGVTTIVDNFNIVYSCFVSIHELKQESIDEIINMLMKALVLLETDLKRILNDKLTAEVRVNYLNTLKILTYLVVEFTNHMEKKQQSSKENDFLPAGSKKAAGKKPVAKKRANTDLDTSNYDWNDMKEKILDALAKIVLLNIQKLWDPPIAEEQFVILITNLCYKLMENCQNNTNTKQKKVLKDHLCHILGIMIKKYNHSYGACVMIVQTLPHYEHFSSLYADLIQTCVTQLGYESILPDLLREFRHNNQSASGKDRDNNLKYYSQFLIELSERLAVNLLPYISLIQDFLDDESYLMRTSILTIYGEIIIKVLNQEKCGNDLKLKQMRNELLDTLVEHLMDVHSTTRSRTLQIWRKILEEKSLPLNYMNTLMKKCIERMEDSASTARKSAFQLLCDLIRKNPYGITSIAMSLDEVEVECAKEEALLNKLVDEHDQLVADSSEDSSPSSNDGDDMSQQDIQKQEKIEQHKQLVLVQTSKVNYLKDTHDFIKHIESAIPKISRLLFSKTQTDVLEVITFFVTCYEHGLVDMLSGIRKMLALISHSEKPVKDAVISAYKRLYLKPVANSLPVNIAKNLIKLVQDVTCYERDALEELIADFTTSGELDNSVIQILWEFFANNSEQTTGQTRLNALILLGMIVKKIPEKGRANIQVLVDYGLYITSASKMVSSDNEGQTGESQAEFASDADMVRFSEICRVFSYITQEATTKTLTLQDNTNMRKKTGKNKDETVKFQYNNQPFKLPNSHLLFERLTDLISGQFSNTSTVYYSPMIENALQCIFKLADNPISLTEAITLKLIEKLPPLKALTKRIPFGSSQLPPVPLFNEPPQSQPVQTTQTNDDPYTANVAEMSRFFTYIGILSTKLLIFLNQSFVTEVKRRKMCKDNTQQENKKSVAAAKAKQNKRKSLRGPDSTLEEEMGMNNGAEAEDAELMFVENLIDQKLCQQNRNSMIAQLLPAIVHILKEPLKYNDETLQLSCALALVKVMLLSQSICNQYVQLLFTLVEKSPNPLVRSQLIIGIGDLVYRFPNALEPWTSHLYLPLRDTNSNLVRMNTIRVLSHLIRMEMIKTRGQIYEIALCTIDPDEKICCMSKAFFQEMAQRNNGLVIYNAMPDIISQLSGGGGGGVKTSTDSDTLVQREISEESFRTIVTYLFTFIKRDKQCETLIEKLCHAFRQANAGERKCRDLVFCLSKIQISENGIKKLKETFKWYADKLSIPAVYDTFKNTIIKNARKLPMLKNETKMLLDELEKQIDEVRKKGLDEPDTTETNEGGEEEIESKTGESPKSKRPAKETKMDTSPGVSVKHNKKRGFVSKKEKEKLSGRRRVISSSDESDSSKAGLSSDQDSD